MSGRNPPLYCTLILITMHAVLVSDVRRAAVSLPFQVHRLKKVLVEAGLVAFLSACFEVANEIPKQAQHGSLAHLPKDFPAIFSAFRRLLLWVLRVGASLPPLSVAMLRSFQLPHRAPRTNRVLRVGA